MITDRAATALDDPERLRLLALPEHPASMILDTDAGNEIDDQFALVYALLATDRASLDAVYAAPFGGDRAIGPAEGMRRSHEEILGIFDRCGRDHRGTVFEGSQEWMTTRGGPVDSPAAADLIRRARATRDAIFVVAIGAPTNVASALVAAPDIARRIVVVWLGGNPSYWHPAVEFNVSQDMAASRTLLDSGVPLVHVPCHNVTEHLRTTLAEVDRYVRPAGALGSYLADVFAGCYDDHFGRSKEIWDLGAVAWVVNATWTPSHVLPSPVLTADGTWSHDPRRHLIREVAWADRDAIFGDFYRRLRASVP